MTDPLEFCILTFVGDFQKEMITNVINRGVAQVVERYFREVEAASSSLVTPMQSLHEDAGFFHLIGNFISYRMKKDMDAYSRASNRRLLGKCCLMATAFGARVGLGAHFLLEKKFVFLLYRQNGIRILCWGVFFERKGGNESIIHWEQSYLLQ